MALYKKIAKQVNNLKSDFTTSEIAERLSVSERTVRRAFQYHQTGECDVKSKPKDTVQPPAAYSADAGAKYTFILTQSFLTIAKIVGDVKSTESIENTDERFSDIVKDLMRTNASQGQLKIAFETISKKEQFIKRTMGKIDIDESRGTVTYCGRSIASDLGDRIIEAAKEDENALERLVKFTDNLHQNPSPRSVSELFTFLEACDIEIDNDGMVVCFKKVRGDYKDCHTGTVDNSVGAEPWMPRWEVDDNSSNTCSRGYHVCSKSYLPHYGGSRVMKVLVNPADFVSIPNDYYGGQGNQVRAKARVCRYKVIGELTGSEIPHYM